jgi:hypothetical protein
MARPLHRIARMEQLRARGAAWPATGRVRLGRLGRPSRSRRSAPARRFAVCLLLTLLVACAGREVAVPTLERAEATMGRALAADAGRWAPEQLVTARREVARARLALGAAGLLGGDVVPDRRAGLEAARLAVADAELAAARALFATVRERGLERAHVERALRDAGAAVASAGAAVEAMPVGADTALERREMRRDVAALEQELAEAARLDDAREAQARAHAAAREARRVEADVREAARLAGGR